jgi:hypothetical protein
MMKPICVLVGFCFLFPLNFSLASVFGTLSYGILGQIIKKVISIAPIYSLRFGK